MVDDSERLVSVVVVVVVDLSVDLFRFKRLSFGASGRTSPPTLATMVTSGHRMPVVVV